MDAFIRNNMSLVLSALYLLAALVFAAYSLFYLPKQAGIADLAAVKSHVLNENKTLISRRVKLAKRNKKVENTLNSIPAFLSQINKLSFKHGVIIRKLVPDEFEKLKFKIEMISDYYRFVKFAAQLESYSVIIHDMEVRPYDYTKATPRHFITFSITPTDDAATLPVGVTAVLDKRVGTSNKRNPFQRFAPSTKTGKIRACIDQTWVHKLSGISTFNNLSSATIDSVDYKEGDTLADMKIKSIGSERVELTKTTKEGIECHVLKFRQKKKDQNRRRRRRT